MKISISLCTYNRCESLRRTLGTFRNLIVPDDLLWELLVVDNNSTDATRSVCQEFENLLPLRYLFEPQQGKSHAINRSIREAKGELVVFTDDDVDITPGWIEAYWKAAQLHPEASFFGGTVLPVWETPPPRWLAENQSWLQAIVQTGQGAPEQIVRKGDHPFFIGANMACRKELFKRGFWFPGEVGPNGSDSSKGGNVRGEEIELQTRLLQADFQGFFVPEALIYHRHVPQRMTESYLWRWYYGQGVAEVRLNKIAPAKMCCGVPRLFWKFLLANAFKYALFRFSGRSRLWLQGKTGCAFAWGVISEFRKRPCKDT